MILMFLLFQNLDYPDADFLNDAHLPHLYRLGAVQSNSPKRRITTDLFSNGE